MERSSGAATAAILGAAACWGALGISYEIVSRHVAVEPVTLVTLRATAAALVLVLVTSFSRNARSDFAAMRDRGIALAVVSMGLISVAAFYIVLIYAYREAGVAVATVLLYVAPTIVALMGWVFYRLSVSRWQQIALLVAFSGVVGVAMGSGSTGATSSVGVILGITAAFTYASYSLLGRYVLQRLSTTFVVTATLVVGSAILWVVKLSVDGPAIPTATGVGIIAVVNGLGTTVAPMMLYTWGLERIGPARASLIASAEPALAVVLAYAILGERMTLVQTGGALAIAAGVALAAMSSARR